MTLLMTQRERDRLVVLKKGSPHETEIIVR